MKRSRKYKLESAPHQRKKKFSYSAQKTMIDISNIQTIHNSLFNAILNLLVNLS